MAMTELELLTEIQNTFDARVIEEIFDAYIKSEIEPSERLIEALAVLCGKSTNEIRKWLARHKRSK
jgi:hypothetical protein